LAQKSKSVGRVHFFIDVDEVDVLGEALNDHEA